MSGNLGPIGRDLAKSLRAGDRDDRDAGAVALARKYAGQLDAARGTDGEVDVLDKLGPKYLAALTALGLTPAGRGVKGGGQVVSGSGKLDELRARRRLGAG
jgi:hypothetical protein